MTRKLYLTEEQFNEVQDSDIINNNLSNPFSFEVLNSLRSFNGKIRYCQTHLRRISSGSSRIVYQINDNAVLKLAKNSKGLAQNENEINYSNISPLFAQVYKADEDNASWIVSEYARKATAMDFRNLIGHSFKFVQEFIDACHSQYGRYSRWDGTWSDFFERVADCDESLPGCDFFYELNEYLTNYQLESIGDLKRPSTYGVADRQNGEEIVIVDYGLTDDTYNQYYRR